MKEKREEEIKQRIEKILASFNELEPDVIEKVPQLKKIQDIARQKDQYPSGDYTVDYTVQYTVWENYQVAV
jgi:hypothetical protein